MSLNFSGQNLSGRSFQGQDLAGANFAHANIRGANFTDAKLRDTNFSHAKGGLQQKWSILLAILAIFSLALAAQTSWMAGVVAIETIFPSEPLYRALPRVHNGVPGAIVFSILAIFYGVLLSQGFATALIAAITVGTGVVAISGAVAGTLCGAKGLEAVGTGIWRSFAALNWALTGSMTAALSLLLTRLSPWALVVSLLEGLAGLGVIAFAFSVFQAADTAPVAMMWPAWPLTIVVVGIIFLSGLYAGWRALKEDLAFMGIRRVAIALFVFKGTRFCDADLTEADFTQALLANTDFRKATLLHTRFHLSQYLERARVGNTLLNDICVRELVTTLRGTNRSYRGRDLRGANLAGADLSDTDFAEADLSQATLEGACLERANLTKAQAIGTNFRRASLTGACLEAWNIDSTTQLDGIVCEFIYLRNGLQERRPSSGIFAPGGCAKLLQVVLDTVDLIFQHGIDWQAFTLTLNQVQLEQTDQPLAIQSIEHKGEGVVVIRVEGVAAEHKAKIHADLTQGYAQALNALEDRYLAQLQSKDEQIELYCQHQADLKALMGLLANRSVQIPSMSSAAKMGKRVILKLGHGTLSTGFPVTLQIGQEGELPVVEWMGHLGAAPDLVTHAHQWQAVYRRGMMGCRLEVPDTQVTHVSRQAFFQDCYQAAERLKHHLNLWLDGEGFRPAKEQLLAQLNPSDPIRFIVQTGDREVQRLPLQLWNFFERYRKAELALGTPIYEQIERSPSTGAKVRILAILGDCTGIDVDCDRRLLEQLPEAEVTFLVEPPRQLLNDQLWAQPWDILFFAGHSSSGRSFAEHSDYPHGRIQINPTEQLSLFQLKHALRKAIEQGLKLAIFNSCDGLGLAMDLAALHIPQMIVMREPVPDLVAQEFLKNFLAAFSKETSLYQSVREAREQLQGLEDRFPCATWLPVICQNPAEASLNWRELLDA
ncbi:MAG: pentapeptide repeat-containing protein [Thermosynechococcaceae cyanobacterium]